MQHVFPKLPKYLVLVDNVSADLQTRLCWSHSFLSSSVQVVPRVVWEWDDATWVMAASFIIFTMQTGCVRIVSDRHCTEAYHFGPCCHIIE